MEALYRIELDVDNNTIIMINDLSRMFIMQVVVQIMFYLRNDNVELWSNIFLENLLFILLGLFIYWFVFNRFVIFDNKENDLEDNYHTMYNK